MYPTIPSSNKWLKLNRRKTKAIDRKTWGLDDFCRIIGLDEAHDAIIQVGVGHEWRGAI